MAIIGFYDDIFLAHKTVQHPERPERLLAVRRLLQEQNMQAEIEWRSVRQISREAFLAVHDAKLWEQVQRLSAAGGGYFDADTYLNSSSYLI